MYGARRELCLRAHTAQRSAAQCPHAGQVRTIRTFTQQRGPKSTLSLSDSMHNLCRAHIPSNTALLPLSISSSVSRQYSTEAEEVTRNRFDNAQATDEAEQTTEMLPVEETPGAFRRKFSLKYVPKALKQDKRQLQRTRMQELEKYNQWGYLRHQYPKPELAAVRKQFNKWKRTIQRLGSGRHSTALHGEDRGKWLHDLSDVALMRDAWEATSIETRQNTWPEIMLSTMRWCPSKSSMVLEATMNPLPPGYAVHDVLRFIAQNLQLDTVKNINDRASMADEVLALLAHILEDTPKGHVPFQQSTLGLYANSLPASQAKDLYDILEKENFKLHKNTRLQFARRLAGEASHKNAAYGILKTMVENGESLNDAASASTVTTLLHCKGISAGWSQQLEDFAATEALQLLIEHGFTPNTITLTAVLDSLCQQGQTQEAIRLALLFAESGVPLDGKTWTTVFAGAKASLNVENVSKALAIAKVTPVPYESVLSNAMHAVFYFADAETRQKRIKAPWSIPMFRPMLKVYAKRHELKSLQWWLPDSLPLLLSDEGVDAEMDDKFRDPLERQWDFMHTILPVADKLFAADGDAGEGKLQPTTTADGVMLRAYIRSLSRPQDILSFYKFFKSRLEEQSKYPSLMLRNQGAMIHDTFILVMTEHQELWREALHVFGDMLKESLRTNSATNKDDASNKAAELRDAVVEPDAYNAVVETASTEPIHPAPTIFTLSVLLRGLLYQGETALAAQMMQVMRELGIEPNLVTWNTLIRHHALAQNTRMTVNLLQEMEAAGVKPDMYTYNAFNKLRNQDKALQMMQAIVDENRRSIVAGVAVQD